MKIKIFRVKLYIYEIKLLSLHTNKEKTMSNISDAVASKGGIITTDSMTGQAEYKRVLRAVDRGELIRLRHGVYAVPEATFGTMIDIDKIVPGGVVCKGSGDRSLIRFCLKDINTPGRARIHQVSSKGHKGLVHLNRNEC